MKISHFLWPITLAAVTARAEFRAGAAKTVITPPNGVNMAGYYNVRGSTGVLDDIHSHALVLDDGVTRVALVSLDLIGSPRELVDAVRAQVEKSGQLPGSNIMISATHAHTGPVPGHILRVPEAPDGGPPDPESTHGKYLATLPGIIAASISQAAANLSPVSVSGVSGECADLAFCRRFYMRDGTVGWNPGKLNPNTMTATGPTDPQVQALFFEPLHKPGAFVPAVAVYANFSMHPDTVSGTKISADYPGVLSRLMSGYHGPECITLYGNGTCGNLNHIDTSWERRQGGIEETNRIGTLLAASIFRAEKSQHPLPSGPVRVKSVTVPLNVASVSPEQAEMARETVRHGSAGVAPTFMQLVRANRLLDLAPREGKPIPAEVQVITLGQDVAWVGLPGEVFVELGLALKKRSPFRHTIIATLTNGNWGYIPDRRSYAEGNYEAESSRVEPGSGEKLIDSAVELLKELHAAGAK
jgi:neutral ceramidase